MPALMLNGVNYSGAGGGGNANEQVLTWAEYCALTPEEKMNGTTYYITDVNGDGQSFQPVIFSLEEREIGVWTDGKPLYQKTVNIGKITQTGERIYTIGIQNVDTIVAYSLLPLERQGDTGLYAIDNYNNSWGSGSYTAYTFKKDSTAGLQIIIYSGYYKSINDIYATVQYTKTTDQPGSGQWTPQGVPAVHYDGNEKVVGTWFGETLYERTINVDSPTKDNWTSMTDTSTWGIDTVVELVGAYKRSWSGGYSQQAVPYYESTNVYASLRVHSNGQFQYRLHDETNNSVSDLKATIRYTKTTS